MKKSIMVILCIAMSVVLSACGLFVSRTGKKAFEEGKMAMASGDYAEALGYFELARDEGKKGKDITELIDILNVYVTALSDYTKGELEAAQTGIESVDISDVTPSMAKDIDDLKFSIQADIEERKKVDERILEAEKLFAEGDYTAAESTIKEIEGGSLSQEQADKLSLLKQQLATAKSKVSSASKSSVTTKTVYVDSQDIEKAKDAVVNFAYAYAAFVQNGNRSAGSYSAYMSPYSVSGSTAYNTQWNYFNKHNITSYSIENISIGSVTNSGNNFYVISTESISETKNGSFSRDTSTWKYTVVKSGGTFKVTNYTKAK